MATLAERHREQELALRAITLRDAVALWPLLDPKRMEVTFPAWLAAQATLIRRDHRRSAALAGAYLRAERLASGVAGTPAVVAPSLSSERIAASMSATARAGYFTALRAGRTAAQAQEVALVRALGATGRLVLTGGRDTVRESLKADRVGRGWRRITGPNACAFCRLIASRGSVFSAETADFAAHDHCGCSVAAVYSEHAIPVRDYEPSPRGRWSARANDADRARMNDALRGVA